MLSIRNLYFFMFYYSGLSIIFTKQVEARSLNKANNIAELPSKNDIKIQENKKYFKHGDHYEAIEESVSNQINSEFTHKYELKFLKRTHHNNIVTKNKKMDISKQYPMKCDPKTNQDERVYIRNKNCGSEEHECVHKDEYQKMHGSTNNLNPDEDTQAFQEHNEKRLDTLKKLRRENESNILNNNKKKSDTLSLENEIYALKQRLGEIKHKKSKVLKEISILKQPSLTQKYQDGKNINKNNPEKAILNIENQKHKRYFETNTNSEECFENITDSEHKLKEDEDKSQIVDDHVENENTDSLEDNMDPSLPFYISTASSVKDEYLTNDDKEKEILNNLNTVLREKKEINNVLNNTINHLVSSKVLDFITDRVTGKVLKKLESLTPQKNQLRSATVKPETEQIGILFQQNGDMQIVMNRENKRQRQL